jgi:hypothetical protein
MRLLPQLNLSFIPWSSSVARLESQARGTIQRATAGKRPWNLLLKDVLERNAVTRRHPWLRFRAAGEPGQVGTPKKGSGSRGLIFRAGLEDIRVPPGTSGRGTRVPDQGVHLEVGPCFREAMDDRSTLQLDRAKRDDREGIAGLGGQVERPATLCRPDETHQNFEEVYIPGRSIP